MDRRWARGAPALVRRVRWGNVGRLAALLAAGTLIATEGRSCGEEAAAPLPEEAGVTARDGMYMTPGREPRPVGSAPALARRDRPRAARRRAAGSRRRAARSRGRTPRAAPSRGRTPRRSERRAEDRRPNGLRANRESSGEHAAVGPTDNAPTGARPVFEQPADPPAETAAPAPAVPSAPQSDAGVDPAPAGWIDPPRAPQDRASPSSAASGEFTPDPPP
jgi:hypothetical protein